MGVLGLGEVLSDDLSGLGGDPVGEVDGKLHDEVAALRRVLGERQALPPEALQHPRLDDVVAGEGDDAVFQSGNADGAATQSLERSRRRRLSASWRSGDFHQPGLAQSEQVEADCALHVRVSVCVCVCLFKGQHSCWGLFLATVTFLMANQASRIVRACKYLEDLANQLA